MPTIAAATTSSISSISSVSATDLALSQVDRKGLLRGEILLETQSYSAWGGAVKAQMYLPLKQSQVWQQLTDYPRWVDYFPDLTHSKQENRLSQSYKRLYQAARRSFFALSAQVEIYLRVYEVAQQTVQFRLEKGSFSEFSADLNLKNYGNGTLLTYTVQAIPAFPVPTVFIQQVMSFGLPANMQRMRQVLCL